MKFDRLSIPGKVFLLGEYAVLEGALAWVAAVGPRFRFTRGEGALFHPDSPAGRFLASRSGAFPLAGIWSDPWEGRGGFGGSTAEFAIAAYAAGIRDPLVAHAEYLSLFPKENRPSGADLIAQWVGGAIEWKPAASGAGSFRSLEEISTLPLLVFSATHLAERKTKTHFHLESLAAENREAEESRFSSLLPVLELARSGLERKDLRTIGAALTRYAEALHELGLEAEAPHADRLAILERPGVLGAKGCGALQTDAMIVLLDDPKRAQETASFVEESLGLKLLSFGVLPEPGIREEMLA